jgi:hypothetical protein
MNPRDKRGRFEESIPSNLPSFSLTRIIKGTNQNELLAKKWMNKATYFFKSESVCKRTANFSKTAAESPMKKKCTIMQLPTIPL